MRVEIKALNGGFKEVIERSTRELTIEKTLEHVKNCLQNFNKFTLKVVYRDCVDCQEWDLFCTLGKDRYNWCRCHNKSDFKEAIKND